ncbi:MAG: patatin-like phospholipase family protein [Deltaproteobacteria bacterium]|nr:patatin-like phospholipase family protein [Deltaproteobacteria bacterium]
MNHHCEYRSVVFAGGGTRCLWQVGFWNEVASALQLKPLTVAAVSAGATMACFLFSGRFNAAVQHFQQTTRENAHNIYPLNVFRGHPVFPQYTMYRNGILAAIDAPALAELHDGPEIRILLSRPPKWAGARLATVIGFLCYSVEKKLYSPVHPSLAARIGFMPEVVTVSECRTPEELADLLLQSSCTPPFTPVLRRDGNPVLDGGIIDNVPAGIIDDHGDMLILLTRQYPPERIPALPGRTYIQPSRPITIFKWDYANPDGLRDAYELGRTDGQTFLKRNKA